MTDGAAKARALVGAARNRARTATDRAATVATDAATQNAGNVLAGAGRAAGNAVAADQTTLLSESCSDGVCVFVFANAGGTPSSVYVTNETDEDVDIRVTFELEKLRATPTRPKAVVPPRKGSKSNTADGLRLATLEPIGPGGGYKLELSTTSYRGDPGATPDGTLYVLPFPAGASYECTQGFDGRRSHTGSSRHSVDFGMPVGSPVTAARAGVVVDRRSGSTVVGSDDPGDRDEGNYVRVRHDDGTYGSYWHLDTVSVPVGRTVAVGDALGRSGNTGYSSGPHLHFAVKRADGSGGFRTVDWKFRTATGTAFVPVAGETYPTPPSTP